MTAGDPRPLRIAAIVSFLPNPYEHFLYRELAGLVRRGADLEVFATRGAMETPPSDDVTLLAARTRYPKQSPGALALAHAWALATRPGAYFGSLGRVLAGHGLAPRNVGLALFSFLLGVGVGREVRRAGRELVLGEWANHPATVAFVAARIAGARFAFAAHAGDVFLYPDPFLAGKARAAEAVVTCTVEGAETLARMAPRTPVFVVHHGLGDDWFAPREAQLRDEPRCLIVGRLEGSKGEDVSLRALALLRDRGRVLPLSIVGAGPRLEATQALARELGLEAQVEFLGALPPARVRALYDGHDVLLLPARRETHYGIPNVLVEAMARGLVCIVSPLPSVARLVEPDRHAYVVPQDDPEAVARALERYLGSAEERRAIAVAGRERVAERFRLARSLEALESVLRDPACAWRERPGLRAPGSMGG